MAVIRREGGPVRSVVDRCHENFVEAYVSIARVVPGGRTEQIGGLTAVRSGMPGSGFNVVFGLNRPESHAQLRDGIERLFLRTGTEFQIVTLPETLDELEPIIQEMHLTEREVFPGMVLDPIPDSGPSRNGALQILQTRRSGDVADFLRTGASGFGMALDYFDVWRQGCLPEPPCHGLVARTIWDTLAGRPSPLRFASGRATWPGSISSAPCQSSGAEASETR